MPLLVLLITSLGISLSHVVSKKLSLEYPVIYVLLSRVVFSFFILSVISYYMRLSYIKSISYWIDILALSLLGVVLFSGFFFVCYP